MSRFRRPAVAITSVLALAGFTAAVSGCSLASPKTIATPYQASDGTNADLPVSGNGSVQLRNFLLVSAAKGAPGVLVGAVTTSASEPVPLQVSIVDPGANTVLGQAQVTATPGQLTEIGPDGSAGLQVPNVPLPPGSVLQLHVQAAAGGQDFSLPVLAPSDQYATITPTAVPTTASPSASASRGPTASPAAASPSRSASPTRSASPSPSAS